MFGHGYSAYCDMDGKLVHIKSIQQSIPIYMEYIFGYAYALLSDIFGISKETSEPP